MKKTLFWVTLLICFGICTANAERPLEARGVHEDEHGVAGLQHMIYVDSAPHFIFPIELGFGVAVGIPYDLFYLSDTYYLCKDNVWYAGNTYIGPWVVNNYESLPPSLRQYRIAKVRAFRDRDYLRFHEQKEAYKGKHFRPEAIAERRERKE